MSKHTPGPWRIDHECILDDKGRTVALVGTLTTSPLPIDWPTDSPTDTDAEAGHNAHLLAAAPDLLAALRDAAETLENCHMDAANLAHMARGFRAAIARAEGGAA
jgi:hypothetical protein